MPYKVLKKKAHTGNFLSRNYWEFDAWKLWILWKMRLWNCEFCQKWDFEIVNFVKNKTLEMWILSSNSVAWISFSRFSGTFALLSKVKGCVSCHFRSSHRHSLTSTSHLQQFYSTVNKFRVPLKKIVKNETNLKIAFIFNNQVIHASRKISKVRSSSCSVWSASSYYLAHMDCKCKQCLEA